MPYRDPKDRLAAKRRYNASAKARATARRYYLSTKPAPQMQMNPAPLERVLKEWSHL